MRLRFPEQLLELSVVRPCPGTGIPAGPARQPRSPPPHIKRGCLQRLFPPLNPLQCAAGRTGPGVHMPGGRGSAGLALDQYHAGARDKGPLSRCGPPSERTVLEAARQGPRGRLAVTPGDTEQGGPGSSGWWRPADPGTTLIQPARHGDAWTQGAPRSPPVVRVPGGSEPQDPPAPSGSHWE